MVEQSYLRGQTNWDLGEDGLFSFDQLVPLIIGGVPECTGDTCGPKIIIDDDNWDQTANVDQTLSFLSGVYTDVDTRSHVWMRKESSTSPFEQFDVEDDEYTIVESDIGATFRVDETVQNTYGAVTFTSNEVLVLSTGADIPILTGGEAPGFGTAVTDTPPPVGDPLAKGNISVDYPDGSHGARPVARWTELPFITRGEKFYVTVSAYHMEGIDRIEFILDGGDAATATQKYSHPTDLHPARHEIANGVKAQVGHPRFGKLHNYEEYMVSIDPLTAGPGGGPLQNGLHEVRCVVYPVAGQPFVLQGDVGRGDNRVAEFFLGDGHHSFWFNVNFEGGDGAPLAVPTRTVGASTTAGYLGQTVPDDYPSLQALFNDDDLPASDPFFQKGGRILLRADTIHVLPTDSTSKEVMSQINTWDGSNKALYFDQERDAGTALTIMADPDVAEHSVKIAPRFTAEGGTENSFGNDASVYYKGIEFTMVADPTKATGDDVYPQSAPAIPDHNMTPSITGVRGANASMLIENCRINGDSAIAWTTQAITPIHGGPSVGTFYKGCLSYLIPNTVGAFVYLYKNSYMVQGMGDQACCQPACMINLVLYAFKNSPGGESPGQHSDLIQYQSWSPYGKLTERHINVGSDGIFRWGSGAPGGSNQNGQPVGDDVSGFQAGDRIIFNYPSGADIGEIEIWMDQDPETTLDAECTKISGDYGNGSIEMNQIVHPTGEPFTEGLMTPGYRKCRVIDRDGYDVANGGTLSASNPELTLHIQDNWNYTWRTDVLNFTKCTNHQDGTFEGRKLFWFANFLDPINSPVGIGPRCDLESESMRGFIEVSAIRPNGGDNRIYAGVNMYCTNVQLSQWTWFGGYNVNNTIETGGIPLHPLYNRGNTIFHSEEDPVRQRSFFMTNTAIVGWHMDNGLYQTQLGMNMQTPFLHGIFDDINVRGFAFSPTPAWEDQHCNQHMLFNNFTFSSIDNGDTAKTMNDATTSILNPIRLIKQQSSQQDTTDWPWADSSIGKVKYRKIGNPCSLSTSEWDEVLNTDPPSGEAPGPTVGYAGTDPDTNYARIETFANPVSRIIPDGRIGEGQPYWDHTELINAWENAYQGEKINVADNNQQAVQDIMLGSPYEDLSPKKHKCGCLNDDTGQHDEREFFRRGNENLCSYYGNTTRDLRDRCICPPLFNPDNEDGCYTYSELHQVTLANNEFTPSTLTDVKPGDVIEWTWGDGTHNVVSGTCDDPNGDLFDSGELVSTPPENQPTEIFTWEVPVDQAPGDYNYVCQAHCTPAGGGMVGTIEVRGDWPDPEGGCCECESDTPWTWGCGEPMYIYNWTETDLSYTIDGDPMRVCEDCAYTTIQDAIDASVDGDIVLVDPGTYNEAINFKGKKITVEAFGSAEETIIDGSGIEAAEWSRPSTSPELVSIVTVDTREPGQCYGDGTDAANEITEGFSVADRVIKGFTIKNATYGTRYPGTEPSCNGLEDCNSPESDPQCGQSEGWLGGGIFVYKSVLTVTNCIFEDNTSDGGGGMFSRQGNVVIDTCEFKDNTSRSNGGGLQLNHTEAIVRDCEFKNNRADQSLSEYSPPTSLGGAIHVFGGNVTLQNNTIENNECVDGKGGGVNISLSATGGLKDLQDDCIIQNCTIRSNTCEGTNGVAGAINIASGTNVDNDTYISFTEICGNTPLPQLEGTYIDVLDNLGNSTNDIEDSC